MCKNEENEGNSAQRQPNVILHYFETIVGKGVFYNAKVLTTIF